MTYPVLTQKYDALPISLEKALAWLRIPESYMGDNDLVTDLIKAAADYVETECNILLGESTFEWESDCLPCKIPDMRYVQSITTITGTNDSGTLDIDAANFSLVKSGKSSAAIKWINGYDHDYTGFMITFKAGIPADKIPHRILMALRVLVSAWYDNRDNLVQEKKTMVDNFLAPYVIAYAG